MKHATPILSITGSDSTGGAGIQADIRTISALGGCALTAVTSVTVQSSNGIHVIHELPSHLIIGQVRTIINDSHPKVVKIGMIHNVDAIYGISKEIVACKRVICDPGIVSSHGERLVDDDSLTALRRYIFPETTLLLLKCNEAEILLGRKINNDDEMLQAAEEITRMGVQWVMLRGAQHTEGRLTALLYGEGSHRFFSSINIDGWQRHGVGGALSSAIATCMAFGDNVSAAISKAHDYLHSQIVYSVNKDERHQRPVDLYNQFVSLITVNYATSHDVLFYANELSISTRYLSKITKQLVDKTPKEVIGDYLLREARIFLETSRLSVQEISYKVGFTSQTIFCKFFRSRTGRTPTEYRNSHNANI